MYCNELSEYKKYHIHFPNIAVDINNEDHLSRVLSLCLRNHSLHHLESIMVFLISRCRKCNCLRTKIIPVSDIQKYGILLYQ